jgi:hypothetical protein
MPTTPADGFFGLFELRRAQGTTPAALSVSAPEHSPPTIPCPDTGRPLKVATVEVSNRGVCPACTQLGAGGYVSFVGDLRLAFACPRCRKLVWVAGA